MKSRAAEKSSLSFTKEMNRVYAIAFLVAGLLISLQGAEASTNQFRFRMPLEARYRIEGSDPETQAAAELKAEWVKAWPENGSTNFVQLGSRVVVQLRPGGELKAVIENHPLSLARSPASNVFILQAPDGWTAAREADRLARLPEVEASYPVIRRRADLNGAYAYQPNDTNFSLQWQLEHRNVDGTRAGVDLNARAAWPYSTAQGVAIAVADTGVELNHPELAASVAAQPHYNFLAQNSSGAPVNRLVVGAHGTEVAGLIAADLNHVRMVGVAPSAGLASWVVVDTNEMLASDEQLMEMYQYQSNTVSVQNFSWGHVGLGQNATSPLERIGISNATTFGHSGRGVVMVRSAGNDRTLGGNANDDGYPSDPRAIAVAAVRIDGRVTSYSEPGACLLVGAPSGDLDTNPTGLFTTDLLGTDGVNSFNFFPPNEDLSGYVFNSFGFSGTSAAAPQIAGVAALVLSANTNLTYRDVQQILILSSRHFDLADPDLTTNGAGFQVSHNVGFGVPDAGVAVDLARSWSNRPPPISVTLTATNQAAIPVDGLRVLVSGSGVPANLASIRALPSTGPQADTPTAILPLADFGFGTTTNGFNLAGKGALIQRGTNSFAAKINLAAQAGAAFAVIYNFVTNSSGSGAPGGDVLTAMGATDFVSIPAVFIGHSDGEALVNLFATNSSALAQIRIASTSHVFSVTNTLICEHVGLRVVTDYPFRGDLRITLVSPSGTRSVLQRYNNDLNAGPVDWTYYSTHHFFESSAGQWGAEISNEGVDGYTGTVQNVSLTIDGVPIVDADKDGLDDRWEMQHFGSLSQGPKDDPDLDGYSNMREQIMGTDPMVNNNVPFLLDLSRWSPTLARLSWAGSPKFSYQVWGGTDLRALSLLTNLLGQFPETEWFAPDTRAYHFFRVRVGP